MAFRPTEVEVHVLQCLHQLEIEGCSSATPKGKACLPKVILDCGVPAILLKVWMRDDAELPKALRSLLRRRLIRKKRHKIWPLFAMMRLQINDGRVIMLEDKGSDDSAMEACLANIPGVKISRGKKRGGRRPSARGPLKKIATSGHCLVVLVGTPDGKMIRNVKHIVELTSGDAGDFYLLTAKGVDLLDDADGAPMIGQLVTLSDVLPLTGFSQRTLERRIKDGKLPPPEFPGGHGRANKWFWHKLRPALQIVSRRNLPVRFLGSQII